MPWFTKEMKIQLQAGVRTVVPKVWVATQRRVAKYKKMGCAEVIQNGNCVFSTSPDCLCHSVIYRYLRKEQISDFEIEPSNLLPNITHTISIFLNTMFASWVAGCPPNSDLGHPKKSLSNAVSED